MKLFGFFVCFLLVTFTGFGQFNYPSFKEVVTTFFSRYSYENYECYLKFQRKKDGWYVSEDSFSNAGNYFNTRLFWSKKSRTYSDLDYPAANGDSSIVSEGVTKYLALINWDYEEYSYQRNLYYGYPGWDWDVINDDLNEIKATDTLLEMKARAYFNYASGFIAEQFGDLFINNDPDRLPLKATELISKSRIEKFIFYEQKAINAYAEILRINPDYETRVGSISIKLANEYMFSYLELMMAGDSVKAQDFARKAVYPDSVLSISKSYLAELPLNSILISTGDNDTYSLWYLQKVMKFRPDISVLNYDLIGFRRFIALCEKSSDQPVFSVRDTAYLQDNFDYFLYGNKTDENFQIDVKTFLSNLTQGYNPYDTSAITYKSLTIRKYYSKELFFESVNKRKTKHFPIGDYLFLNDYMVLDIINTSRNRRVFFTYNNELLSPLLARKGSLYEVQLNDEE